MDSLIAVKDKMVTYCKNHPKIAVAAIAGSFLYLANKGREKYRYTQKEFNCPSERNDKAILITGCGHGFGNILALKLSIECGYRVIATCRTQKSVDELLSNSVFTENKSTSVIMDVTDKKQIEEAKEFTINYLQETDSILWGIVNNAGLDFFGPFEVIQPKLDKLERDILLNGPLDIIRAFLPLLPGRKNYKPNDPSNKLEIRANGGRIVTVSSIAARMVISNSRYGASKAAISYATHALRMQLSPRFGIWCSTIEPGGFQTNIIDASMYWTEKNIEAIKENGKEELLSIYEYDVDVFRPKIKEYVKNKFDQNCDPVINDIVHALTAKYPKQEYIPGNRILFQILEHAPFWLMDYMIFLRTKKFMVKKEKH